MARWTWISVLALLACKPTPPNGAIICSAKGECPDDYFCASNNTCWANGSMPDFAVGDDLGGADLAASDLANDCGCTDSCANGAVTHFACVNGSCQMNGGGNCGLYATCASSTACSTTCAGDGDCIATAWCDLSSHACKAKSPLGGPCSSEPAGDHECQSPNVCSWVADGKSGMCVPTRCTGCAAAENYNPTTIGCITYLNYGIDPRGVCPYHDECHKAFCSGQAMCDFGQDQRGNYRACGAVTCTNDAKNVGTVTGYICTDTMGCQPAQTEVCSPYGPFCFPCAGSNQGCDPTQPHGGC
jgi:hypothetical protein